MPQILWSVLPFIRFGLQVLGLDAISENTVEEVLECVEEDAKQRFNMTEEDGELFIRANQGHSMPCVSDRMLMEPITDPAEVSIQLLIPDSTRIRVIIQQSCDRLVSSLV